jgi:hypothetical protein
MGASARTLDKTGASVISAKDWTDIVAGVLSTAEKFGFQNDGSRALNTVSIAIQQVGTNDGNAYARTGLDTATISPPFGIVGVREAGAAAWGGIGENRYIITAITALGETNRSFQEVAVSLLNATDQVRLTWLKPPGAALSGYKVYRTQRLGVAQTAQRIATISDEDTLEFVDTDQAGTAATAPPATNTTAGDTPNYGTVPSLSTTPITLGEVAVGQAVFYWVNWVISEAVSEIGNPRQFARIFSEAI